MSLLDDLIAAEKTRSDAFTAWAKSVTPITEPQAPRAPITNISNVTGLGLNIYQAPATLSDYVIDGTSDSAVLIQPGGKGSTLSRFHITRGASLGSGPGWARHGVYAKAENVTLEDFWVQCDPNVPYAGQVFSVRDAGFTCRRFHAEGLMIAAVFQDGPTVGTITFEDGTGTSTHPDTAVWIDTPLAHTIVFRRCHFTTPGVFVRASSAFTGTVVLEDCTPSTASVPNGRVVRI